MNNYTSRTNRKHKSVVIAWISNFQVIYLDIQLPSNILGYPRKYPNYNSKKQFEEARVDNSFTLISQNFLLNIKYV